MVSLENMETIGQEQCRTITELEFDPKPDKIIRAFYIFVRSSPRPPR
jgi:hypothetical protein